MLETGTRAPLFTTVNQFGETVQLGQLLGDGPVVLVFFPLAFSGICTGELCELRDNLADFDGAGVTLVGISVDSKFALRTWAQEQGYDFSLLSDFWPHGAIAESFGIFDPARGVAHRATFLIGQDGIIHDAFLTAPGQPRPLERYRAALATLAA